MHKLTMTLFRLLTIALVAVWATALFAQCVEEVPAIDNGPIAVNGPAIAAQCPEACPNFSPGQFLWYAEDAGFDYIAVQCSDAAGTSARIYSTTHPNSTASTCWNCVGGCGVNCPAGELCMPVPYSSGSDCHRFSCPAGFTIAERQAVVNGQTSAQPYCWRERPSSECTRPPVQVDLVGPSSIRTGQACSWSASASGGAPGASMSYTWYVSNNPVGYGPYYTGGRPSGTLVGYSWRLRVTVTDGYTWASDEILVSESSYAPMCWE